MASPTIKVSTGWLTATKELTVNILDYYNNNPYKTIEDIEVYRLALQASTLLDKQSGTTLSRRLYLTIALLIEATSEVFSTNHSKEGGDKVREALENIPAEETTKPKTASKKTIVKEGVEDVD